MATFRFSFKLEDQARVVGQPVQLMLRDDPATFGEVVPDDSGGWRIGAFTSPPQSPELDSVLVALSERRLPPEVGDRVEATGQQENVGNWLSGQASGLVIDVLPDSAISEIDELRADLMAEARRLHGIVRWVVDLESSAQPLSRGRLEFSLDEHDWHTAPGHPPGAPMNLRVLMGMPLDQIDWDAVSAIARSGQNEPVGHSLIREALALRPQSPRSAVVLGAAAAETAIKEAIHTLAPDATFLIDEMASPSPLRLLNDYLPSLESLASRPDLLLPPPRELRKALVWMIETRNKVVHNREQQVWFPELLPNLLLVRDLVWILDYHCGHEWAINNVSSSLLNP